MEWPNNTQGNNHLLLAISFYNPQNTIYTCDSISSAVYVTRKSRKICVRIFAFSCLLTFNAFGATSTTFTAFRKYFSLYLNVKETIKIGAVSCYRLLLNLDLSDSSRNQNSKKIQSNCESRPPLKMAGKHSSENESLDKGGFTA